MIPNLHRKNILAGKRLHVLSLSLLGLAQCSIDDTGDTGGTSDTGGTGGTGGNGGTGGTGCTGGTGGTGDLTVIPAGVAGKIYTPDGKCGLHVTKAGLLQVTVGAEFKHIHANALAGIPKTIPEGTAAPDPRKRIADINGDSKPDEVVLNQSNQIELVNLVQKPKSTMQLADTAQSIYTFTAPAPLSIIAAAPLGDLDGDTNATIKAEFYVEIWTYTDLTSLTKPPEIKQYFVYGKAFPSSTPHNIDLPATVATPATTDGVRVLKDPTGDPLEFFFVGDIDKDSKDNVIILYTKGTGTAATTERALMSLKEFQKMVASDANFPEPSTYIDGLPNRGTEPITLTKLTGHITSAAALGDVNGDGTDDFGIVYTAGSATEDSYAIVLGDKAKFDAAKTAQGSTAATYEVQVVLDAGGFDATTLEGVQIKKSPSQGAPAPLLSAMGDINDDGYADVLAGSHIIFGSPDITTARAENGVLALPDLAS